MTVYGTTFADIERTPRDITWRGIRNLRANPPGHAGGVRQATFAMALEQAEQLFAAAETIGPAARPLTLFYGLAQAGRAISAARIAGDDWQSNGHGIAQNRKTNSTTVADFSIEPTKKGLFPLINRALGSSNITASTRLGDLWPLLAETHRFPLPGSSPYELLTVNIRSHNAANVPISGELIGLPSKLGVVRAPGEDPSAPRTDWADEEQRVREFIDQYPALAGYQFATGNGQPIGFRVNEEGDYGSLDVHWLAPGTPKQLLRKVAVNYAGHTNAYPCLDGTNVAIHPLTVWWATLFGLSILARYEPEIWGNAININTSQEAAAVENLLNVALESLPELVLRVLNGDA